MMRRLKIISDLSREISFIATTWNPESKMYVPKEESFPVPMNYIDVTRNTHTSLDVWVEKILMITGTLMEKENNQMHGQVSGHLTEIHGPETDEETSDLKT